ncbi:hypothetical protein [Ornithinimicrobium kibberense]|uniref:hypothetical protein n=1 Tax=Ornithinimicrobium kibberense TaxID=282060 RepID=UPI003615B630
MDGRHSASRTYGTSTEAFSLPTRQSSFGSLRASRPRSPFGTRRTSVGTKRRLMA